MSALARQRCAIYTRKSSEEGLEQEFNSLDAQREACEAFIVSQRGLGWSLVKARYDDGGFSGGSMERPALKRLLADITAGQVDVVVVYKIDRLTRSLADFARMVELFDQKGVSFVSITQQFNTTTSMGRLTLNVLLSFAQFEREVTAERIRDKIAASKRKGMWMGGLSPLGYDVRDKQLVVNRSEAETVRTLFQLYLAIGSVRRLKEEADRLGIVTKRRHNTDGGTTGGHPFSRGHLYALLANPVYVGKVQHRGAFYDGRHEAIINSTSFDEVRARLAGQAPARCTSRNEESPHLLTGILFDETGDRLSPTHAVKQGRRYRYYISHRLGAARRQGGDGWRLPAKEIEKVVLGELTRILRDGSRLLDIAQLSESADAMERSLGKASRAIKTIAHGDAAEVRSLLRPVLHRVSVRPDGISLEFQPHQLAWWLLDEECASADPFVQPDLQVIDIPMVLQRRGVEARFVIGDRAAGGSNPDGNLTALIAKAHQCLSLLTTGGTKSVSEVAETESMPPSEVSRILPLAFLAPDIVQSILRGDQPVALTAERLKRLPLLPVAWAEQRKILGTA